MPSPKNTPTLDTKTSKKPLTEKPKSYLNSDLVTNPVHYLGSHKNIECIDAIQESMSLDEFKGYLKGTIIKYLWRAGKKETSSTIVDLEKAHWFLTYLLEISKNDSDT